ncbi:uncharacterized protein TEOVI_000270600 [Trypanosoma equiperdum]|uniref:Uncharacterized protein n=3 Tax=Trypanozoon TaxID=39700 RepID=C9ZQ96_TRYB9|nr:hypothetical protein, unlikely [Trypanosoma brucei gambiense DAL972]RHW71942.1 hypothetical protein DPX39_060012400 [Trypanosoma brucei equiperdum]CBH11576.1 hypothetical protein, unlikely [Trypanosoma brucei gambiense DAL972]SCU71126.1 hypothetical protein, conserved [Trypanosoma equiperdum]|eukprot:XP_011773861.1 hypothetical protein, unlikely [Trypanosoma brucei gambiense DAL972]
MTVYYYYGERKEILQGDFVPERLWHRALLKQDMDIIRGDVQRQIEEFEKEMKSWSQKKLAVGSLTEEHQKRYNEVVGARDRNIRFLKVIETQYEFYKRLEVWPNEEDVM